VIEKNNIEMRFELFKTDLIQDPLYFHFLNNRELDLKISGINTICEILFESYDSTEHSVSTNLEHKVVYDVKNFIFTFFKFHYYFINFVIIFIIVFTIFTNFINFFIYFS
jgi:hypothetical protein